MNFSQHWRSPAAKEVGYQVLFPRADLLDWLARNLPEYVADCRAYPSPGTPLEDRLREQNWPTAEALDDELLRLALNYFGHDLLLERFGDGAPSPPGYVLNTLDKVEPTPEGWWFVGQGREDRPGAAYQDI